MVQCLSVDVKKKEIKAGQWWHIPLIPAIRRQRHTDICELKTSLFYRVSSSQGYTEKPCLQKQKSRNLFLANGFGVPALDQADLLLFIASSVIEHHRVCGGANTYNSIEGGL